MGNAFSSVHFYYDRKWPGFFRFQCIPRIPGWDDFVVEEKKKEFEHTTSIEINQNFVRVSLRKLAILCTYSKCILARWIIISVFLQLYIAILVDCFCFYIRFLLFLSLNLRSVRQNVELLHLSSHNPKGQTVSSRKWQRTVRARLSVKSVADESPVKGGQLSIAVGLKIRPKKNDKFTESAFSRINRIAISKR